MGERVLLIIEFGMKLVLFWMGMGILFESKIKRIWIGVTVYIIYIGFCLWHSLPLDLLEEVIWFFIIPIQFFVVQIPDNKKYGWLMGRIFILCYIEELVRMMVADSIGDYGVTDNQLNLAGNLGAILIIGVVCWIRRTGRERWDFFYQKRYRLYIRNGMIIAVGFMAVTMVGCAVELHYVADLLKDISPNLLPNLRGKEISLLAMIGIGILLIFVAYIKNSNERMEELLKENQSLRQKEIGYYEGRLKQEEETRDYRHNMDGQIRWMLELLDEGDLHKIRECLNELYGDLRHIRTKIHYTGNRVLDDILHSYISDLDESVAVTITGRCDCELSLSDTAWCTVCSNLIHNAVEYLNQCTATQRFLKIKMETGKNNFEMKIINYIEEDALSFGKDGKLLTTKKDFKKHGIGLKNVERTVCANHGIFEYHVEDHSFCCMVILNVKNDRLPSYRHV